MMIMMQEILEKQQKAMGIRPGRFTKTIDEIDNENTFVEPQQQTEEHKKLGNSIKKLNQKFDNLQYNYIKKEKFE